MFRFFVLLAFFTAMRVYAQAVAGLGGISGTVTDPSGAAVPDAQVRVQNRDLGVDQQLTTSSAGVFSIQALRPAAHYAITVNASGFAPWEAQDLQVQVGNVVSLNIILSIQASTDVVQVVGAPITDDTQANVSQVVNERQITFLPINGRRVDSFVLLSPATTSDGTFGLLTFRGNPGGNTFLLDGNDITQQFYGENAGRTRISSQVSQDAVQEFQVLTSGYSAEFGRATGGVVNTLTRSGTNDVHGTAFWFFRNRTLNARDRYASFNPSEYRHQAGVSIGGPIVKDKLFYFANYEATRRNFPLVGSLIRGGVISGQNFVCGAPATAAQCAAANAVIQPFFGTLPRTVDQDVGLLKIDWRPTERHSFSASANLLRWVSPNGIQSGAAVTSGNQLSSNGTSTVRDVFARFNHTWIVSPTTVNDFRFGFFKDRQADDPGSYMPPFGNIAVSVGGIGVGVTGYLPRINPSERRFQWSDTFSWTAGKHSLRFGFDISRTEDYINSIQNRYGQYNYGTPTAFAQDLLGGSGHNYQTFVQTLGNPVVNLNLLDAALFLQDEWRLTPKLTLQLGLRYDYTALPAPTTVNADYPQTGRIPEDQNNVGPRLGFAYRLNDKTVVRAGGGIFYGRYTGGLISTLLLNNNLTQQAISLNSSDPRAPIFPNPLTATNIPGGSGSVAFAAPNLRTPYTINGDVAIQREISRNTSLTVSYIFNRGIQFFTVRDLNLGPLGNPVTYQIADASRNITGSWTTPTYTRPRPDPRYNGIYQVENGGRTYYDGLAVQLNKRYAHNFQASVSYTWSHAIDTNLGGGSGNVFFSAGPTTFYNGNYEFDRGTSALDQRHRAVISFVWDVPMFNKDSNWFLHYIVNGWQLASVTTLASSQGVTPFIQVTGSPVPNALFSGTVNGFNGSNRVPFLPLNSIPTDPIYRADARFSKTLSFSERYKAYLFFEAFNLSNSQYNTSVQSTAYFLGTDMILRPNAALGTGTATAGFPDGTNARRAQVGARFVF